MKTIEDVKNAWLNKVLNNFWTKVKKTENCWQWIAGTHANGYGAFSVLRKEIPPHRFSWMLHKGTIPEGYWVLHKCDNRLCVNPDHLFVGDVRTNVADMLAKKRQANGERSGNCKLTEEIVKDIRASYIPRKMGCRVLARKYNCSPAVISQIVHHKTWRHI